MNKRFRGIFLLDALFGTMIAVTVTSAVVVIASTHQRAADRLAQKRADVRQLESALTQLQSGQPVPTGVEIQPMAGALAPPGWIWVGVTTVDSGHRSILRGLVPAKAGTK